MSTLQFERAILSVKSHRPDGMKLLALHSFRTSSSIFKAQMRRAGWLAPETHGRVEAASPSAAEAEAIDIHSSNGSGKVEVFFLDGPFEATGPVPEKIREFFPNQSYREWFVIALYRLFIALRMINYVSTYLLCHH